MQNERGVLACSQKKTGGTSVSMVSRSTRLLLNGGSSVAISSNDQFPRRKGLGTWGTRQEQLDESSNLSESEI